MIGCIDFCNVSHGNEKVLTVRAKLLISGQLLDVPLQGRRPGATVIALQAGALQGQLRGQLQTIRLKECVG